MQIMKEFFVAKIFFLSHYNFLSVSSKHKGIKTIFLAKKNLHLLLMKVFLSAEIGAIVQMPI